MTRNLNDPYVRNCRLDRVVDGDTVDLIVDMGWDMSRKVRFRLLAVDTPELNSSDEAVRAAAKEAKQFVEDTLAGWAEFHVGTRTEEWPLWVWSVKTGKYGRWLADIGPRNSTHTNFDGVPVLNELLLDGGYAVPYPF